jgi:hypothetical protein
MSFEEEEREHCERVAAAYRESDNVTGNAGAVRGMLLGQRHAAREQERERLRSACLKLATNWRATSFVNLVDRNATVQCAQELEALVQP